MKHEVLTEEQRNLIVNNIGYIKWWFNRHNVYSEDRAQSLLLELCYRIPLYTPERGNITTFMDVVFDSGIKHRIKYEKAEVRLLDQFNLSLDYNISTKDDDITLLESVGAPDWREGSIRAAEAQMVLDSLYESVKNNEFDLNDKERDMFLYYMNCLSYVETGKMFNMSKQGVNRIIEKVRKKILERRPNLLYD